MKLLHAQTLVLWLEHVPAHRRRTAAVMSGPGARAPQGTCCGQPAGGQQPAAWAMALGRLWDGVEACCAAAGAAQDAVGGARAAQAAAAARLAGNARDVDHASRRAAFLFCLKKTQGRDATESPPRDATGRSRRVGHRVLDGRGMQDRRPVVPLHGAGPRASSQLGAEHPALVALQRARVLMVGPACAQARGGAAA
jgi:hypothetical protein